MKRKSLKFLGILCTILMAISLASTFLSVSAATTTNQSYYDPEGRLYITEKDDGVEFEAVINLYPEANAKSTSLRFKGDIVGDGAGTITAQLYQTGGSNLPCHLKMQLQRKQTGGNWTKVDERTLGYTAYRTNISASTGNQTSYWRIVLSGTVGNQTLTPYYTRDDMLFNKKASYYLDYVDPISSRKLPVPATNYPNLPPEQRVQRSQSAIDRYKMDYVLRYNKAANINWSNYNVHHIRPLQFGGDNSMQNLFTLPAPIHQGVVNAWWRNY